MTAMPFISAPDGWGLPLLAGPDASFEEGAVVVSGLRSRDPDIQRLLREAADPGAAANEIWELGVRVWKLTAREQAGVQLSDQMDSVAKKVEEVTRSARSAIDEAASGASVSISSGLDALLASGGALDQSLASHIATLQKALSDQFDPDSKASVLSTVEASFRAMVAEHHAQQAEELRNLLSPGTATSPLGQLRSMLLGSLEPTLRELRDQVVEQHTATLTAMQAAGILQLAQDNTAIAHAKGTAKGAEYEDDVQRQLALLCQATGDQCESTGTSEAANALSKKGDHLVTIHQAGLEANIAFESKNVTSKWSAKKVRDHLDAVRHDRGCDVAVIVFSDDDATPSHLPLEVVGDGLFAVSYQADGDGLALRVAYQMARVEALRKAAGTASGNVNLEAACLAVDLALESLQSFSQIKGCATKAKGHIDAMLETAKAIRQTVEDRLTEVASALATTAKPDG